MFTPRTHHDPAGASAPVRPRARLMVVLVANALLRVASGAGGALVGFYLAFLARQGEPVDPALVGTIGVVANVAELVGAVPLGMLADRYTSRTILVWSTLVGAVAVQLFGISGAVGVFLVSRSLESVASVAGGPALLAHLTDITRHDQAARGRVMGYYELSLLAGLALGNVVGGTLWDRVQTWAFALLAAVYLVVAALFWWSITPPNGGGTPLAHPLAGLKHALRDPLLLRLAPAWLLVNAVIGVWLTHLGYQLSGPAVPGQALVGQFTPSRVGVVLLGYAGALVVGVLAWTVVLPRMGRVRALRISLVALSGVCVGVALLNAPVAWLAPARWGFVALVGVAVMIGSGFTPAALAFLADVAGERTGRGAALGLYTCLFSLGNAVGAAVGGAAAQVLALNGLIVSTLALLAVALVALQLLPNQDTTRPPAG